MGGNSGAGARVRGFFLLIPGTSLHLTVGSPGGPRRSDGSLCGYVGCGSWALAADGSPLVVAGGGGSIGWTRPGPGRWKGTNGRPASLPGGTPEANWFSNIPAFASGKESTDRMRGVPGASGPFVQCRGGALR